MLYAKDPSNRFRSEGSASAAVSRQFMGHPSSLINQTILQDIKIEMKERRKKKLMAFIVEWFDKRVFMMDDFCQFRPKTHGNIM